MWDDWNAIQAEQRRVDEEARQRHLGGGQLPVVTDEPIAAPGPPQTPVDESRAHLRLVEPEPSRQPDDLMAQLRKRVRKMREMLRD